MEDRESTERALIRSIQEIVRGTSTTTMVPTTSKEKMNTKIDESTYQKTRKATMTIKRETNSKVGIKDKIPVKMECGTKSTSRQGNLNLAESLSEKYRS